jgi:hypothetical protein
VSRTGPRRRSPFSNSTDLGRRRKQELDLALHLRVVWRFRYLVAAGLIAACGLTILTVARVELGHGKPRLVYRKAEIWGGSEKLLITQAGVPWGRLALPTTASGNSQSQTFADPSSLSSLAPFYAQLANSDAVQRFLPLGAVRATPVVDTSTPYASVLPILQFNAVATSPKRAKELAASAVSIFRRFVTMQQAAANIPPGQRVLLEPLNDPAVPQLVQGRKKSLAIVVFMTVLVATLGLAFILENLRPRVSALVEVSDDPGVLNEQLVTAHGPRSA